jgi:cytochrome d ubiquinol oxidase subunit II
MRTVGELHLRTRTVSTVAALVTLVCFALAGVWVLRYRRLCGEIGD